MRKLAIYLLLFCLIVPNGYAQPAHGGSPSTTFTEVDGAPSGKPKTLKFDNSSLTDNGDGSFTHSIAGGGAGTFLKLNYSNDLTSTFLRINDASTASTDTLILADAIPAGISGANYSVIIGHLAGAAITTGDYNYIAGYKAANTLSTGGYNVVIGPEAGVGTAGNNYSQCVLIGYRAGNANRGADNFFLGRQVGEDNTTGQSNVAIGSFAFAENVTGGNNVCIGNLAGNGVSTKSFSSNVFIGSSAGRVCETGGNNVYIGQNAGYNLSTGQYNTFVGYGDYWNTTGSRNTGIGYRTLLGNGIHANNIAIGYYAGAAVTTGGNNTIIGYQGADNLTTGTDNIWIDYDSDTPAVDTSNYLRLGDYLIGDLNAGSTVGASLQITAGAATQIPLILKGAAAQSADYFDVKTSGGVIVTQLASTGAQTWNFGGDVVTNIAYSTPGGYPGIVGTYSSSALWALGGKSGQASWGRSGEYGFKHYTGGYMELGVAGETTSSLAQLLVSNSTGTTKTTLILRNQADQTGNAFTCQNSTPANGFQIEADFDIVAGSGAAGKDYTFTFDGETNDVTLTAMEDEKALKISDSLILDSIVADPGTLIDGQMWYRSDLDEFRGRVNGVTYKFVMQAI